MEQHGSNERVNEPSNPPSRPDRLAETPPDLAKPIGPVSRSASGNTADVDAKARRSSATPRQFDDVAIAPPERSPRELLLEDELEAAQEKLRRQTAEVAEFRALVDAERARFRELFQVAREGHVVSDLNGAIQDSNVGGATLLNLPAEYLIGKPIAAYVAANERREFRTRQYRARTGAAAQEWTTTFEHFDLPALKVKVALTPVIDETGAAIGLRYLLRDESGARSDLVAARAAVALLRSALDALSAHIVVLDSTGRIVTVNRAWACAISPGGVFEPGIEAGTSYLELCDRAMQQGRSAASVAHNAVSAVLHGSTERTAEIYSTSDGPDTLGRDGSWFSIRVARCDGPESANIVVTHEDVTADYRARTRERALMDERTARAAAEAASQAKSEFLATLSHELRTPLNAIAGYAQLMEMGVRGPVTLEQAEDLRRILRSERHLLGLINELLNFSRLERGEVSLELRPLALAPVVNEVLELIEPQAASQQLSISVACEDSELAAMADREKVRQILVNILSNALKFTRPGGSVRIDCVAQEDMTFVRVTDTGIGIPPPRLDEIFDPFVQVHRGTGGLAEGVGLGLAISRNLARAMHGDLSATSQLGRGSCFELRLPRARIVAEVT